LKLRSATSSYAPGSPKALSPASWRAAITWAAGRFTKPARSR
jgi:hypothetical protein